MHNQKAERQTDQRKLYMRQHAGCRLAADARMHDHNRAAENDRENGKHARSKGADAGTGGCHHGHDQGRGQRTQWNTNRVRTNATGFVLPRKRQLSGMVTA